MSSEQSKVVKVASGGYSTVWTEETRNVFPSSVKLSIRTLRLFGNAPHIAEFIAHHQGLGREQPRRHTDASGSVMGWHYNIVPTIMKLYEECKKKDPASVAYYADLEKQLKVLDTSKPDDLKKQNAIVAAYKALEGETFEHLPCTAETPVDKLGLFLESIGTGAVDKIVVVTPTSGE